MKAMQVNKADHEPVLIMAELQKPEPRSGEILIQVRAAGVTTTDWLWCPTFDLSRSLTVKKWVAKKPS